MIDFLKRLYRRKSNSTDPVEKKGYELAERARTNPFVRAYLDTLVEQYDADERELDIRFAAYLFSTDLTSSIDNGEDNIEEYARLVGVSDDLISRARVDRDAHALMRVHTRLGMDQKHKEAHIEQADGGAQTDLPWRAFLENLPETLGFDGTNLFLQKLGSNIRDYGNDSGSQTFHAENGRWTIYAWNLDIPPFDSDEQEHATREILEDEVVGLKSMGMEVDYDGAVLELPITDANREPMHMGLVSWNKAGESIQDEALALIIIRDLVIKLRGSIPDVDSAHLQFITVVSSAIALHSSHN
jgi:hypothetical protein